MRSQLPLFIVPLLLLTAFSFVCAQTPSGGKSVSEIKDLVRQSKSKEVKTAEKAQEELSLLQSDSIPSLFQVMKTEKPCNAVVVAGLITELNPTYPELVPEITKIVRGGSLSSLFHLEEEFMCRRQAAFLLPFSTEGLKSILNMLKKGTSGKKKTAIFALDDFTEVGGYNDHPGEIEVMMEIVPALAALQKSKDKVIN